MLRKPIFPGVFMCAMLGRYEGRHREDVCPMQQSHSAGWLNQAGNRWHVVLGFFLVAVSLSSSVSADSPANSNAPNTIVRFEIQRGTNSLGRMDVELFDRDKPETVRNFLLYTYSGAYSNTFVHRCVPGFVLQGGGFSVTNPMGTDRFSAYLEVTNLGRLTNEFLVGPR